MIVVGGLDWRQAFGASAVVSERPFGSDSSKVEQQFLAKAEALGRRVTTLARDWRSRADGD